jgi:hypothetical protein
VPLPRHTVSHLGPPGYVDCREVPFILYNRLHNIFQYPTESTDPAYYIDCICVQILLSVVKFLHRSLHDYTAVTLSLHSQYTISTHSLHAHCTSTTLSLRCHYTVTTLSHHHHYIIIPLLLCFAALLHVISRLHHRFLQYTHTFTHIHTHTIYRFHHRFLHHLWGDDQKKWAATLQNMAG